MGVPGLYRWLCERYPKCVIDAVEKMPQFVGGVRVDPDTSLPNPNGVEYDNLYLDMNGIIHPACHPEDLPAPVTEEEMYLAIFKYIDRVFGVIRPRKLLFMAVDGVAPRAKMNQQRSRRYRTAKEIEDKRAEEARLRDEWAASGKKLPPKKPPTWDHNVITPGTAFMHRLSSFLRYYIHNRVSTDPGWKNVKVVLSAADVPGEGEHKVMEFIRLQRQQKGYNPNTRHCIHGKDADLIMLALATHEPHFSILRELDLNPHNRGMSAEQLKQKHAEDQNLIRLGEADEKGPAISCPPFKLIQMNIVREYLDKEFRDVPFCFPYDLEAAIDDFVLFCFFAGNDFLPHLPSLDIHEGAIGEMIRIYKEAVTQGRITGWLSSRGNCNLERCGVILQELGKLEDQIFRRRKQKEEGMANARARRERENSQREAAAKDEREARAATAKAVVAANMEAHGPTDAAQANKSAAMALKEQLMGSDGPARKKRVKKEDGEAHEGGEGEAAEAAEQVSEADKQLAQQFLESLKKTMDEKAKVDQPDEVKLYESGWKERYYKAKFDVDIKTEEGAKWPKKVVQSFMEGICWTLLYYYRGCPSWIWYYPYHYAPFASDFVGLGDLDISFPEKTEPFQPYQQLMACLPPLSRHALPEHYQKLMTDPKSPIIDFYPKNFRVDMNGKKMAWLGVAILPFIDEKRLLQALQALEETLTDEERQQNLLGSHLVFIGGEDTHAQLVSLLASMSGQFKLEASSRTEAADGTFINDDLYGVVEPWHKSFKVGATIPSPAKRLPEIHNKCICVQYTLPPLCEHIPKLLSGVVLDQPVLTEMDRIVEGRKLLDGPPGGGRGGGRPQYHDGSRRPDERGGGAGSSQYGGQHMGHTPMHRMINMGLTGAPMGMGRGGGGYEPRGSTGPGYGGPKPPPPVHQYGGGGYGGYHGGGGGGGQGGYGIGSGYGGGGQGGQYGYTSQGAYGGGGYGGGHYSDGRGDDSRGGGGGGGGGYGYGGRDGSRGSGAGAYGQHGYAQHGGYGAGPQYGAGGGGRGLSLLDSLGSGPAPWQSAQGPPAATGGSMLDRLGADLGPQDGYASQQGGRGGGNPYAALGRRY